jgi:hypothetical protein
VNTPQETSVNILNCAERDLSTRLDQGLCHVTRSVPSVQARL